MREYFWRLATAIAHEPEGFRRDQVPTAALERWLAEFAQDVEGGRLGYPSRGRPARQVPDLEDALLALLGWPRRESEPTLCLTHDIDYLAPTAQMRLKRAVVEPFARKNSVDTYLSSITRLLKLGGAGNSTVFVAAVGASWHPASWLIDPSYSLDSPLFAEFLERFRAYGAELGLHGSLFSLSRDTIGDEKARLERRISAPVVLSRQHWLRLPKEGFSRLAKSGFTGDSTLGWNGTVGFRGGIARPFPLPCGIWEVPLVLMDGPLFHDRKLSTPEVVALAKKILGAVLERRGTVAINWHDRAADPSYGWAEAYERILEWASKAGFRFRNVSSAIKRAADDCLPCPSTSRKRTTEIPSSS